MKPRQPKTPSPARVAAGRANGLKSRSTKSPEGIAASARNATTHGFSAATIVLSIEDPEAYRLLRETYLRELQPINSYEEQMVDDIVIAKWRHRRLTTVETTTLELELLAVKQQVNRDYAEPNDHIRLSAAYRSAEKSGNLLSAINRHASRLFREYGQALRLFHEQRLQPKAPPQTFIPQNEGNAPAPTVINEIIEIDRHSPPPQPEPASARITAARHLPVVHKDESADSLLAPMRLNPVSDH